MSGAVKTAANAFMSPVNAAISFGKSAAKGNDLGMLARDTVRGSINPVLHANDYGVGGINANPGTESSGIFGAPDKLPDITIEDPAAVAEADRKNRARVKRQAEIDILTDRPGRGGTVLTDNYSYKV